MILKSFYINNKIKYQITFIERVYSTFTVPCEKSKTVSFTFSLTKNIVVFSACCRFHIKWICLIAFGSASRIFVACLDLLQSACTFLEICIIKQATNQFCSHLLDRSKFSNVVIFSYVIFYWLIKKVATVNYYILVFYFCLWKKILCVPSSDCIRLIW